MALTAAEFMVGGFVVDANGALVTVDAAGDGAYKVNGMLRDSDGRLVITTSTVDAHNANGVLISPQGSLVVVAE